MKSKKPLLLLPLAVILITSSVFSGCLSADSTDVTQINNVLNNWANHTEGTIIFTDGNNNLTGCANLTYNCTSKKFYIDNVIYLKGEPIYRTDILNWSSAYIWGNHALFGYDITNDSWQENEVTSETYTFENVGIGTDNPSYDVHVRDNAGSCYAFFDSGIDATYKNTGFLFGHNGTLRWNFYKADTVRGDLKFTGYNQSGGTALEYIGLFYKEPQNQAFVGINEGNANDFYFRTRNANVIFNEWGDDVDFRVESDNNANMFLLDASADDLWINSGGTSTGNFIFSGDVSTYLLFSDANNNRIGIDTNTPDYPLDVDTDVSGISIYALENVSATGYLMHTTVYDKSKGNATDWINDADTYLSLDNTINHSRFYGYVGDYPKTYEITVFNKTSGLNETKIVTEYIPQVSLNMEVDMLRQAVYEMFITIQNFEDRIAVLEGAK